MPTAPRLVNGHFADWMIGGNHNYRPEDVQILLRHTSIQTTEKSYAPWVKARQNA
jgi:integrase